MPKQNPNPRFTEGQRVIGVSNAVRRRPGTIRSFSPSSPHVVYVQWDGRADTMLCGTAHVLPEDASAREIRAAERRCDAR